MSNDSIQIFASKPAMLGRWMATLLIFNGVFYSSPARAACYEYYNRLYTYKWITCERGETCCSNNECQSNCIGLHCEENSDCAENSECCRGNKCVPRCKRYAGCDYKECDDNFFPTARLVVIITILVVLVVCAAVFGVVRCCDHGTFRLPTRRRRPNSNPNPNPEFMRTTNHRNQCQHRNPPPPVSVNNNNEGSYAEVQNLLYTRFIQTTVSNNNEDLQNRTTVSNQTEHIFDHVNDGALHSTPNTQHPLYTSLNNERMELHDSNERDVNTPDTPTEPLPAYNEIFPPPSYNELFPTNVRSSTL